MTPTAGLAGRSGIRMIRTALLLLFAGLLSLMSGCRSSDDPPALVPVAVPGMPTNLTVNVGTQTVGLGWDVPSNGGSAILDYEVFVEPTLAVVGTTNNRALIGSLTAGTNYTFNVRARNAIGFGSRSSSVAVTTQTPATTAYQALTIGGDTSVSGVFDPSVLRVANGDLWMSYSSVHYYNNGSNQLVQDVGIRLARSTNGGAAFNFVTTIASPSDVTLATCGVPPCTGRWVYETSWLIDDATDPNATRRFKLFAHKYFLRPASTPATFYHLGAIVMWTAASPDGTWSAETSLLGWNLSPPELAPLRNANGLHADLTPCLVVSEGTATVRGSTIDFAFACPYQDGAANPQKIVLLRSADHAGTFQYVSTLLSAADAAPIGATHFSAPSLLAVPGSAPVLLVTPVVNGVYSGCIPFPLADDASGNLFRVNNFPAGVLYTPPLATFGGACSYDRGLGTRGILQSNLIAGATPLQHQFRIHATQVVLQRP